MMNKISSGGLIQKCLQSMFCNNIRILCPDPFFIAFPLRSIGNYESNKKILHSKDLLK